MKSQNLNRLADYLVCPRCHKSRLLKVQSYFKCTSCKAQYPIVKNIPIIVSPKKQSVVIRRWKSKQGHQRNYFNLNKTPRIKSLLEKSSKQRFALDICCGAGTYSDCFKSGSIGFDMIPYFIEIALCRNKNPDNIFLVADANEFPFKEKVFDLAYCGSALEHFPKEKSEELIRKILKSSRDLIIVDVPNDSTLIHKALRKVIEAFYRPEVKRRSINDICIEHPHLRTFTLNDLKKFGFKCYGCIGHVTRTGINFPLFWDIYDKIVFRHPLFAGTLIGIKGNNKLPLMKKTKHSTREMTFCREVDCSLAPKIGHKFSFNISKSYLKDKKVLDIGCWTGIYINLINRANPKIVVGIDIKAEALRVAKDAIPDSKFIQASVFSLPFKKNAFDVVTLWAVIEHLPSNTESKALCEINRVLKENGMFFLVAPNNHILSKILDPTYFLTGHRHYSKRKLMELLASCNFKVENSYIKGGLFVCLSSIIFYLFKYIFRKSWQLKILNEIVEKEYARDSGGFNVIYLVTRKIG